MDKKWLLHLLLMCTIICKGAEFQDDSTSFGCYRGIGDNYVQAQCDNCFYGVPCLCVKVLNVPEIGDVRKCYANPHNSLDHMVGTCMANNYQGHITPICYCDTPFCNSAPSVTMPMMYPLIISCVWYLMA